MLKKGSNYSSREYYRSLVIYVMTFNVNVERVMYNVRCFMSNKRVFYFHKYYRESPIQFISYHYLPSKIIKITEKKTKLLFDLYFSKCNKSVILYPVQSFLV